MATLTGVMRLGKDAKTETTKTGKKVASLSLCFKWGLPGEDKKHPVTWINASLWGKQAETLEPYLKKGSRHYFVLDDLHLHTYKKQDGEQGVSLEATVVNVELLDSAESSAPEGKTRGGQDETPL